MLHIEIGLKALRYRAIARNTVYHEMYHYNDYNAIMTGKLTISKDLNFNDFMEQRAYLADLKISGKQNLPGYYFTRSKNHLYNDSHYTGSTPPFGFKELLFNWL